MARKFLPAAHHRVDEGLEAHVEAFLRGLVVLRYPESTRQEKRRTLGLFVKWLHSRELTPSDLDESLLERYLERVRRLGRRSDCERRTLKQFLGQLRDRGVVPRPIDPARDPGDVLVARYTDYLRRVRGLSDRSVLVYCPIIRDFVVRLSLQDGRDLSLDPDRVRRYLLDRSRGRLDESTRLRAIALRSFLRFLFVNGELSTDLSSAVPPVRRWSLASVPQFLPPEDVERVLVANDQTTARGRRDHAMLLLLARLGLRPGEVAALELGDIHWTSGEILVRGKGGYHGLLPLPEEVGEALASYLRHARGPSPSRRVFLRAIAPHVGLTGPCAVCAVARDALRRAGVHAPGRVGAHLFRHSLATRMIRHGASLEQISQVLRHRSVTTTQIYAKVAFETLRGIAGPWPMVRGGAQ